MTSFRDFHSTIINISSNRNGQSRDEANLQSNWSQWNGPACEAQVLLLQLPLPRRNVNSMMLLLLLLQVMLLALALVPLPPLLGRLPITLLSCP